MSDVRYEYQGIRGLKNIAASVGISAGALHYRIHRAGMTVEEAVAQGNTRLDPGNVLARYEYQGARGLKNISDLVGINSGTLHRRIHLMGMTIEEAIAQGSKRMAPQRRPIKPAKEMPINHNPSRQGRVPVKYPDQLSNTWKLALGMRAMQ